MRFEDPSSRLYVATAQPHDETTFSICRSAGAAVNSISRCTTVPDCAIPKYSLMLMESPGSKIARKARANVGGIEENIRKFALFKS